jgi:ABC-type transporter Mla MlaB component
MIEHTTEMKTEKTKLQLTGELMASDGEELRALLINLFRATDVVEINFSSATDIDTACLQLLCAAHRYAAQCGKHIRLNNDWPVHFQEAVTDLGFLRRSGCSFDDAGECLWVKGQHNG